MSTTLIALAATAAALALTWIFCLRPMRRDLRAGRVTCCTDAPGIDDRLTAARHELAQLQADRGISPGATPPRR